MADTDLIKRLIAIEARKKGVPPDVALALVQQESSLNPSAVGDQGRSVGLFQLQEDAATDAGIDPAERHKIVPNIEGGVEYLRQSLARAKGNVPLALEMYNKGPALRGQGDPQYSTNVMAQMPQQGAGMDAATRAAMEERLRAIQQRRQPPTPAAPAPPAQGLPAVVPQPGGAPAVLQSPGTTPPGPARPAPMPPAQASPATAAPETLPGGPHLVIDIVKPSAMTTDPRAEAIQAIEPLVPVDKARLMQGAFSPTKGVAEGPELPQLPADVSGPGYIGAAKMLGSMALSGGGAALGAMAGAPFGLAIPGAMVGGGGGYGLATLAGLEHPSWLGAAVNTLAPGLPAIPRLAKGAVALTRAGRALTKAEQETAEQATKYLEQYTAAQARGQEATATQQASYDLSRAQFQTREAQRLAERARRAQQAQDVAAQQTQTREAAALAEHQTAQTTGQEVVAAKQAGYDLDLARFQTQEAQRLAGHARRVQRAQQVAEEATQKAQTAYAQESREVAAAAAAEQAQADAAFRAEVQAYQAAEQAHTAAAQRLQALPERYMPQVPARTMQDVRRDMVALEAGDEAAQTVVQRLGVQDIPSASAKLAEEGNALMQGGASFQAPRPGEPFAPSYRQPPTPAAPAGPDLLQFIRQQGGMRLTGEELGGEFGALVRPREAGTSGLLNNRTGKTAQQLAEAAQEQGFIPTADKESLLAALRQGTPVYGQGQVPPVPTPAPTASAPRPSTGRGRQRASQVLYDRFDEVAGSTPVDLTPAIDMARIMREQMELSAPSMRTVRLRKVLEDMEAMGSQGSATQTYQLMKDIGPLTRSNDGKLRGTARQLYNALHDSMAQSAPLEVRQLLDQAKTVWRQEHAVGELQEVIGRRGAAILKKDPQGRLTLNVATLLNKTDDLMSKEGSFFNAFAPEELAALRADLQSFIGTPARPSAFPEPAGLVRPKDIGAAPPPVVPRDVPPMAPRLQPKSLVGGRPPDYVPEAFTPPVPVAPRVVPPLAPRLLPKSLVGGRPPDYAPEPFTPPAPVEATVQRPSLKELAGIGFTTSGALALAGMPYPAAAKVGVGLAGLDLAEYVVSQALLSPQLRPILLKAIQPNGRVDPRVIGELQALMSGAVSQPPEGGR